MAGAQAQGLGGLRTSSAAGMWAACSSRAASSAARAAPAGGRPGQARSKRGLLPAPAALAPPSPALTAARAGPLPPLPRPPPPPCALAGPLQRQAVPWLAGHPGDARAPQGRGGQAPGARRGGRRQQRQGARARARQQQGQVRGLGSAALPAGGCLGPAPASAQASPPTSAHAAAGGQLRLPARAPPLDRPAPPLCAPLGRRSRERERERHGGRDEREREQRSGRDDRGHRDPRAERDPRDRCARLPGWGALVAAAGPAPPKRGMARAPGQPAPVHLRTFDATAAPRRRDNRGEYERDYRRDYDRDNRRGSSHRRDY
jgi:hypothetical protein